VDVAQLDGPVEGFQRSQAVELARIERIAGDRGNAFDQRQRFRAADQVHGPGGDPQGRCGPCPAPVGVRQQLHFVDHGDIDDRVHIDHFDGGRQVSRVRDEEHLLPGTHACGHPAIPKLIEPLVRQQPERGKIGAALSCGQRFEPGVALPAVGRAEKVHQIALHPACDGEHRRKIVETRRFCGSGSLQMMGDKLHRAVRQTRDFAQRIVRRSIFYALLDGGAEHHLPVRFRRPGFFHRGLKPLRGHIDDGLQFSGNTVAHLR